jgi:DNA-binding NarL/FixJ family response regulator
LDDPPPVVKVLIADDSVLVRRHLVALLSSLDGIEVVGEAEDVDCAIESVRRLRPQAVVLDIAMPGGNGIHVLRQIKREFPETKVIMLTNNANAFYRNTCLKAGASFFFDKSSEFEKVGAALRALHAKREA